MNAIRSFIAIELPKTIQQQLDEIISRLKSRHTSAVRWVPAHNIHLTIKFLGDVSPTNMDMLMNMLKAEVSQQPVFSISVGGLGAFPTPKRPRVLWIGIDAPAQLAGLVHLVEAETVKLGYLSEDRPFSPHLTLGRVSQNATPDQVRQIADALAAEQVGELGRAEVREVVLFKSELRPTGAEYAPLLKVPLQKR
jgi:RNA 2',3'-cyclic 3'-phosphodiesterase